MKKKKPGPSKGKKHTEVKRSPFGTRLFDIRKRRGITQSQLGEKVGVSKRVVAFYEGDHSGPPPDLLKKLSDALGITVSYLLGESPLKEIGDTLKPTLRKYINKLKCLPPKEQNTAFRMIDALATQSGTNTEEK